MVQWYDVKPEMIESSIDPYHGLNEKQRAVIEEIRKMDAIPFLAQVPFLADPRTNEDVALHEWGHAEVALKNGITVLGIEVKDRGSQKGVTWLSGIHSYDAFLRTAAAGAAAAGSYGLAGDKAAVGQIAAAWGVDRDALFFTYQGHAAADFYSAAPDPGERKWVPRMLAHLEQIHGGDLDLVKQRARLDAKIEDAGLTREQVMTRITVQQQERGLQQQQEMTAARALLPQPQERTEIITTDDGDVVNHYRGEQLLDSETHCPVCGKPTRECQDIVHEEFTKNRFKPPQQATGEAIEDSPVGLSDEGDRQSDTTLSNQTHQERPILSGTDAREEESFPNHHTIYKHGAREEETITINGITYLLYRPPAIR